MAHPDNETAIERAIGQTEKLYVECFRMAERIMAPSGADFETREAREKYQAFIPLVALDIKNSMSNFVGMEQVPQSRIDESQSSLESILDVLRKRNNA